MDEDKYIDWQSENYGELLEKFMSEHKDIDIQFQSWCFDHYQSLEASKAEYWAELQWEEEHLEELDEE